MPVQQRSLVDLADVLSQVRTSLAMLLHQPRGGAVKIVSESEAGEEVHALHMGSCSTAAPQVAPTQLHCPPSNVAQWSPVMQYPEAVSRCRPTASTQK